MKELNFSIKLLHPNLKLHWKKSLSLDFYDFTYFSETPHKNYKKNDRE